MSMTATEKPDSKTPEDQEPIKPKPVNKDPKRFIKDNLGDFGRPITKITMTNVSPSYWRVNVWGRKANSTCSFGDNEIITSKFIRLDVDKDGSLVYNDVTSGKEI